MRLPVRLVCAAIAAMLLSSCWWAGPPFYTPDPANPGPLKPGLYRTEEPDPDPSGKVHTARIVLLRDGSLRWIDGKGGKDALTMVTARLDLPGRDLWITQIQFARDATVRVYGLIERRGGDLWVSGAIVCDDTADIVRAAGGTVSGGGMEYPASNVVDPDDVPPDMTDSTPPQGKPVHQDCSFPDRASLERAMRAYVATSPDLPGSMRMTRIGD